MDKARTFVINHLMRIKDGFSLAEKPSATYLEIITKKFKEDHWTAEQIKDSVDSLLADAQYADSAKYGRYPSYADFIRVRAEPVANLDIPAPTTNIKFIQDCFLDVCRYIHRQGIIWVEYCEKVEKIPYGNKMFVKRIQNPDETVQDCLLNKEWILDDLIKEKEETFPDYYFKFPGMRKMEKYAFACKLGVFALKK